MANKDIKRKRDQGSTIISLRLSPSETVVLDKMMKEDEWSNRSGFVKYKIFGNSEEYQYKKMLESGRKDDIERILIALITELNKQIDYVNFRFDYEMKEFIKQSKKIDESEVKKWLAHVLEWKNGLQNKTDEIFFDCQTILKAINIDVERKDFNELQSVPDYQLENVDWTDNNSPEMQEKARRLYEEFYSKHPNIAATRPDFMKKNNKTE